MLSFRLTAGTGDLTRSAVSSAAWSEAGRLNVESVRIQARALGRSGDVAIGFSTSGNSPNVIRALQCARGKVIPSNDTARIQEMHILLGHILCAEIETRLGLA